MQALAAFDDRLTTGERADLYRRVLGAPGGRPGVKANRDFQSLWILFIAEVLSHAKDYGTSNLAWPQSTRNAGVRKAAADLTANLSQYGKAMSNEAARLAGQLRQAFDILRDPQLQATLGARDLWQLVERVNQEHLGGKTDTARCWALADAGRRIFDWLAAYAQTQGRNAGADSELIEAAEAWLAASDTTDSPVQQSNLMAVEAPTLASRPVDVQELARDLFGALGIAAESSRIALPDGGLVACFHGARQTGKTLATYVLAHALSRSVVRVDLASVLRLHPGAIEKHLAAAFFAAEQVGAVLLIDEADALFGRRTDTGRGHDPYAHLDISSLVERVEMYPGLIVLSTVRNAVDPTWAPRGRRRTWRVLRFPRKMP